jgi:histidinol-phosphate aminotransferase
MLGRSDDTIPASDSQVSVTLDDARHLLAVSLAAWVASLPSYENPHAGNRRADVLRLDNNEHTGPLPPSVVTALVSAVEERLNGQSRVSLYPDDSAATTAVARYVARGFAGRGGWQGCQPDNILITNGCDQAIDLIIRAYCDSSTVVVSTKPTFPMYSRYVSSTGASFEQVAYQGEGTQFSYPASELLDRVENLGKSGTRVLVILTNPDPPTGSLVPGSLVKDIRGRNPEALILVDEAYFEFCPTRSLLPAMQGNDDHILFVRSMSKCFGLAGLRVGYIIGSRRMVSGARPGDGPQTPSEFLRKTRGPYDVNELGLAAAYASLDDTAAAVSYVDDIMSVGRPTTIRWLRAAGVAFAEGAANFCLVKENEELPDLGATSLAAAGVLVRPQPSLPDCGRPGSWFRMSYPRSSELDRLSQALASCGVPT